MKNELTIAFYQQDICWEDPQANYAKVSQYLQQLSTPVDIIVVPETFNTGFSDNMARMAEFSQGATYQFALDIAKNYDALFVGTWTINIGNKVVNRLHWVQPDGTWGYYDKGHTFRMSSEASQLARGTERKVFEWRGWHIKPAVCYDLRFPKWLRNDPLVPGELKGLSYDLLIVSANWPASRHEAWSTLLKARAIENECYVVGVNRVGTDGVGIPYSGDSVAIDFRGKEMAACEHAKEELKVVTLNKEAVDTFRNHWPFYLDAD